MTVTVEEARTLLGTAFIFSEVFDEYTYHAEPPPRAARPQNPKQPRQTDPNASGTESDSENGENKVQAEELDNAAFEIPLNTLIECLNIFGTAGPINPMAAISGPSGTAPSNSKQAKKWRRVADDDSDGEEGARGRGIEAYFGPSAGEKRTGMRLSYSGAGYPLTLIMYVCLVSSFDDVHLIRQILIEQKMQLDLRRHVKSPLSIQNLSLSFIMTMTKRMFFLSLVQDLF
jgi:cell cycle checkpoint protein